MPHKAVGLWQHFVGIGVGVSILLKWALNWIGRGLIRTAQWLGDAGNSCTFKLSLSSAFRVTRDRKLKPCRYEATVGVGEGGGCHVYRGVTRTRPPGAPSHTPAQKSITSRLLHRLKHTHVSPLFAVRSACCKFRHPCVVFLPGR
jgi:hypothetical protein